MTRFRTASGLLLATTLGFLAPAQADTAAFRTVMGNLYGETSNDLLSTGAMLQLVNLGQDGIFNPIKEGSWVGGDDAVMHVPFSAASRNLDGWLTAGSFDLSDGSGDAGILNRIFELTLGINVSAGTRLGIRWFPSIAASNDYQANTPDAGTPYGQFTRQTTPVHDGTLWQIPGAAQTTAFDPLLTSQFAESAPDPDSTALASFKVLVPEPSSALMVLAGLSALFGRGRRRAR